jgi:phosphopantothenoylcysteine decarboxylase/phosphopantothenate--cysteine ligase
MKRLTIIVTAGPTTEPIDPVRFISNRSTGAMGRALAGAAKKKRHKVILIDGSAGLSARGMLREVLKNFPRADAVVMAAAVADYRPLEPAKQKIKKEKTALSLKLVKNPDILAELGRKKGGRILVGFALETQGLYKNALKKLKQKRLDLIVANRLTKRQDVFGPGKTSVLIIDKNGNRKAFSNVTKDRVAEEIIKKLEKLAAA